MSDDKLYVIIRSFDSSVLENYTRKVMRGAEQYYLSCSMFPLPRKKRSFVVNRSPHVHKKSREHFALIEYKRCVIVFGDFSGESGGVLRSLMESDAFSSSPLVSIDIKKR